MDYHNKHRDSRIPLMKSYRDNANKKASKGVYLVIGKNGSYVGQSKRIELRIRHSHMSNNSKISPIKDFISYEILEYVQDKTKRLEREAYWIDKLNPSLNIQLSS